MNQSHFSQRLEKISLFVKNRDTSGVVPRPNKELFENCLREKYDDKILIHFTLDKKSRARFRKDFDVPIKLDSDKEINKIISKVGSDNWEIVVIEIFELYNNYKLKIKNYKALNSQVKKQCKLASELSSLMREQDLNLYSDDIHTPFDGLIAKYVLCEGFVSAISAIPHKYYYYHETRDIISSIAKNTINSSGYNLLPAILDDFAKVLESGFVGKKTKAYLDNITTGKLNFKEHAKRSIFKIIKQYWPSERNPNKEVALIANLLLGLEGKEQITPNDISQMNKGKRRKYGECSYFNF